MYTKLISEMTKLNAEHIVTLMLAYHRTLDGLARETFAQYVAYAEQMGADWLASFHAAETSY